MTVYPSVMTRRAWFACDMVASLYISFRGTTQVDDMGVYLPPAPLVRRPFYRPLAVLHTPFFRVLLLSAVALFIR